MFKYFKKKNKNNSEIAGFTLVETLIAISIFSLSIVGLMSVLGQGISDTNQAKHKMTASYLAEEGIEYIRNMRDTYVLYDTTEAVGWTNFISKINPCMDISEEGCKFDDSLLVFDLATLNGSTMKTCSASLSVSCSLYYDSDTGRYKYDSLSGTDSGFKRIIFIILNPNNQNEIKVSSIVSWSKNGIPYNVVFSTNLLKWRGE